MKRLSFVTATAALIVATVTAATPAFAGWYGAGAVVVMPPPHVVYVAPAPRAVYVAPPLPPVYVTPQGEYVAPRAVYVAPPPHPAVWVPGHWVGRVWVPAHYA